jgi:ATP-dependent Clp protease ATP-binding subunit ClpC
LLSILRDEDNIATQILEKFEVNYEVIKELLEYHSHNPSASSDTDDGDEDSSRIFGNAGAGGTGKESASKSPEK